MKTFKRLISDNEWLYIRFQENFGQFNIQLVLRGEGVVSGDDLKKALTISSENQPIARAKKQGKFWIDTHQVPEIIVHHDLLDLDSVLEHPVIQKPMPIDDHTVEIHFFNEGHLIVFQIFHGIMDGKGALMFVQNTFKALNGIQLDTINFCGSEVDFIQPLKVHQVPFGLKFKYNGINEYQNPSKGNFAVKRLVIEGEIYQLVPKLCQIFGHFSVDRESKWMIPVDIRRHRKGIIGDSNLTLPIFVHTNKEMTDRDIAGEYLFSLKENQELNWNNVHIFGVSFGGKFMGKFWMKGLLSLQNMLKKFGISGLFSFLGKVNLRDFDEGKFMATDFFAIPPYQPLAPFTMIAVLHEKTTELVISYSTGYISHEKMNQFLCELKSNLENE